MSKLKSISVTIGTIVSFGSPSLFSSENDVVNIDYWDIITSTKVIVSNSGSFSVHCGVFPLESSAFVVWFVFEYCYTSGVLTPKVHIYTPKGQCHLKC